MDGVHHSIYVHAQSVCAEADERRIQQAYTRLIEQITHHPTQVGSQVLGEADRERLATLFMFRRFVSDAYSAARSTEPDIGYHEFVDSAEALLWDRYRAAIRPIEPVAEDWAKTA